MRLRIFPKNLWLRVSYLLAYFLASVQLYYFAHPSLLRFEVAYRWKDFNAFVRIWLGLFWFFLLATLALGLLARENDRREFGGGRRGDGAPLLFIGLVATAGLWKIGERMDEADSALTLLPLLEGIGALVLLLAAALLIAYIRFRRFALR